MKTTEKINNELKKTKKIQFINNIIVFILIILAALPISLSTILWFQTLGGFIVIVGVIELIIFNKKINGKKNYLLDKYEVSNNEEIRIETRKDNHE